VGGGGGAGVGERMEADGMKKLNEKQHNENKENFSTFFAIGNF